MLTTFFAMAAISVDLGLVRLEQRRLSLAVDSAALAGVALLREADMPIELILQESQQIAQANAVESTETTTLNSQVGFWNPVTRLFHSSEELPGWVDYNAVNVQSTRQLPLRFAPVMGVSSLRPSVQATAVIGGANHVTCMVPFAVDKDVLIGKQYGDRLDIGRNSPGNWGKLDIGGNMSSGSSFLDAMENGVCLEEFSIGDLISPGTGFAQVRQGWERRLRKNPYAILSVVEDFPDGNSEPVVIQGFFIARLISQGNGGSNWTGEIEFVNGFVGSGSTGPQDEPYAKSRVLVY